MHPPSLISAFVIPSLESIIAKLATSKILTIYSIITPLKYQVFKKNHGKWSICSFGANAPFSIIFSKVFKT